MPPLAPATRAALQQEWLALTRHDLPALAAARGWPIALDHCFARVLLDNAVGGCWYDAIPRRPAYRHAADAQLTAAVDLARAARDGTLDLHAANARSLAWRRARKDAQRPTVSASVTLLIEDGEGGRSSRHVAKG